jgi:hypothetical protein
MVRTLAARQPLLVAGFINLTVFAPHWGSRDCEIIHWADITCTYLTLANDLHIRSLLNDIREMSGLIAIGPLGPFLRDWYLIQCNIVFDDVHTPVFEFQRGDIEPLSCLMLHETIEHKSTVISSPDLSTLYPPSDTWNSFLVLTVLGILWAYSKC